MSGALEVGSAASCATTIADVVPVGHGQMTNDVDAAAGAASSFVTITAIDPIRLRCPWSRVCTIWEEESREHAVVATRKLLLQYPQGVPDEWRPRVRDRKSVV